jgi:hypothetical protein
MNLIRVPYRKLCSWYALFSLVAVLVFPVFLGATDGGATITYRRVFKGSNPEFIEIKVSENGPSTFDIRQLSEDADPEPFQVGDAVRARIFELAGELHDFNGVDLDVHRRIADLGEKTFRYERGAEMHEVHYNYTLNHSATQLALVFEGLFQQQRDLSTLEQRLRYDRLGVNDALHQFEDDLGQRTLPEPERLLPVLDRIAADSRVVDVARQLARALAERIRMSLPPDAAAPQPATNRP